MLTLLITAALLTTVLTILCVSLYRRARHLQQSESQAPVRPYISPEMVADDDIRVTGNLLCENHQAICDNLMDYFEKEKPYLNPNVKIMDIADHLNTNKSYLSKIINSYFRKNFSQFINWYRIRDAMELYMRDPKIDISTMADKSGFQSMTTFNTAFTRYTGMTPGEWCKKYKNNMRYEMVKTEKKTREAAKGQAGRTDDACRQGDLREETISKTAFLQR
ncbi:MAG: AraC family transcriptional regulator [Bacteroidales bacterium]|nr:AraC family transcriptional regulator [Bacteroidales bacterium]